MLLTALTITVLSLARTGQCFPQSLVTTVMDSTASSTTGQVLPLEITKFHVNSTIQFRYARTQVVSHFKNPGTAPNQADFTMVIPDSAFISNFSMIIKGVEYVAEVKGKEEAKKTFDEAVSDGKGAAIVSKETRDSNIFTVSTNIEPGQKVVFKLLYEELLERKAGIYVHAINIDPNQIVKDLRVEVFINESLPISKLSVPELVESNEVDFSDNEESQIADIERNVDGYENNAKIVFAPDKFYQEEAGAQGISGQFVVKYDVDRKGQESEVQVIDGYFVHYFVPENLETLPKHAIFVLDVSGSMGGEKMEQLKDSMFTVLDDMDDSDYFNIITFHYSVSHWDLENDGKSVDFEQIAQNSVFPIPATKENIERGIRHILELQAGGGTNINDAMLEGLQLAKHALQNEKLPKEVKSMIVFLTDGIGSTSGNEIKSNIKNANSKLDVPIFCIGFGKDADFNLLKDISEQANSFSKRIYEGSDAALQLEDFYAEIASPLISNLKFEYVGGLVNNSSISSTSLKTFFKGGEYVIAGKLEDREIQDDEILSVKVIGDGKRGSYERNIEICLQPNNENKIETEQLRIPIIPPSVCVLPSSFPPRSLAEDFMQKLHAFINIKQLIKESDLSNEEPEGPHRVEALKLALDNNFVTDLTSLVVVRPDEKPTISSKEKPGSFPEPYSGYSSYSAPSYGHAGYSVPASSYGNSGYSLYSGPSYGHAGYSAPAPSYGYSGHSSASSYGYSAPAPLPQRPDILKPFKDLLKPFEKILNPVKNVLKGAFNLVAPNNYATSTATTTTTAEYDYDFSYENKECTGNLTLFSKTYLRGDTFVVTEEAKVLADDSFDNLSVSASVSGSCCWKIFSEKGFNGRNLVLSSQGTYTSVSSLGDLFRDVSSVRKYDC